MANAPGVVTSRGDRMTRSNRTVALDRHSVVHRLFGSALHSLEVTGTILTLILISDAVLPLYLHIGPHPLEVSTVTPLERACYWLAYAFVMLQVLIRPHQIFRTAMRNPLVLALVLLAGISVIWSDDPSTTQRRVFAYGMWTLFGYYLATRYDTRQLVRYLAIAFGFIALGSLATVIVIPAYGRESGFDSGAWRGVFVAKNVLGEMMMLSAVVFGTIARRPGRARVPALIAFMLSVALIYFSQATAALLIVAVLTITIPVVLMFRRNNAAAGLIFALLVGVSALGSVAIAEQDAVLSVLGKDATLTGRTVLWKQAVSYIEDRPLIGHGYGAFWVPTGAASERIRTAIGWETPHSHNGLLDEWLDLGLAGVLCLLGAYLLALRKAWLGLRSSAGQDSVWAMAFLVMLFLGNTTESSISQSQLIWAIFVSVACMRWAPAPEPAPVPTSSRRTASARSTTRNRVVR